MHRIAQLALAAALSTGLAGDAAAEETTAPVEGLGLSVENAIEVCRPQGQRAWLARLLCPDQTHATFSRIGSVGQRTPMPADISPAESIRLMERDMLYTPLEPGQTDHHMVDGYTVACGSTQTTLHLDMYHCDAAPPRSAPPGFTLLE